MTTPLATTLIPETEGFASAVIDALSSHICVTDSDGTIIAVNRAWRNFAIENPPFPNRAGVGTNYLTACHRASGAGSEGAERFALGVQSILEGKSKLFEMEYPCHSPTENRWYLGRVTPLNGAGHGAVISHMAITDRKLLEQELVRLATTDPLTALPNRRYFMDIATLEVERVTRFGATASIAIIDLDHFKDVNDSYGHAAGDEVLRCISLACKTSIRQIDVLARMGGEEFVVLFPGTREIGAVTAAEKIRQTVAETPVMVGQNSLHITASLGVSDIHIDDRGVESCLDRADMALYAAKRAGRNRVMSYTAMALEAAGRTS
jgi:diguanylate cyclase (GGDEF)-like protein